MKAILTLLVLCASTFCFSQDEPQTKDIFLRIYNSEGKKIAKGKLVGITDTSITLECKKSNETIDLSEIGSIKTKRSYGHHVGMGTAIGGSAMTVLGAATIDTNSNLLSGNGFWIGALLGAPSGAIVGGITGLFKNSQTFDINNDQAQWDAFKTLFQN